MKLKPRSISFLVCLLPIIVLSLWVLIELIEHRGNAAPQFTAILISGYSAICLLGLTLLISPLIVVLQRLKLQPQKPLLLAFRRSLGLSSCWMASIHLLLVIFLYLNLKWGALLYNVFLSTGVLTFVLLVTLALTSFTSMSRLFGVVLWKELHMLVYAAAVLGVFHLSLSAFAPLWVIYFSVAALFILFILRLLPKAKTQKRKP